MKLNLGKCINITANRKQSTIRFIDGTVDPRKPRATYLGAILIEDFNNTAEIHNRISDCTNTANKLKLFWNKANTEISWKLQVFNAIIRSKLLYGLETIQLTNAEKNRINAFHIKCLRRILKIPPTFEDKLWTNDRVIEKT